MAQLPSEAASYKRPLCERMLQRTWRSWRAFVGRRVGLNGLCLTMVIFVAVALAEVVPTGSSGASGKQASAPGITASTIKVALITSLTGGAASTAVNIPKGFAARIKEQNAQGGVEGRKITFVTLDDQTSPSAALTAAQLAASQGVFAIDDNSPLAFVGAKFLTSQGIPVVGGDYDGPEWTLPSTYPNMFSWQYVIHQGYPAYTEDVRLIKKEGGTRLASIGYGISPSSSAGAVNTAAAAKSVGLQAPYVNASLPFGTQNVLPIALVMKSDNVDSLFAPIDNNTLLALVIAAKQAGVNLKVPIFGTGYGQTFLQDGPAVSAAQGGYFVVQQVPVEQKTPATLAEQAAFKRYENFTGIPDFGWTEGWGSADLLIKGLEVAGNNPTRQSFINNLRKVKNYTAGGLSYPPVNFAKVGEVPAQQCQYFVKLVGTKFQVIAPVPICGGRVK